MSYEKVLQAKKVIIGTNQTVKALLEGKVQELVVASDVDPKVTAKLINKALELKIPVQYVDSKKRLGNACGIEVGASTAAIIR